MPQTPTGRCSPPYERLRLFPLLLSLQDTPYTHAGGPMTELATNVLSYVDNLDIRLRYLPDASVEKT